MAIKKVLEITIATTPHRSQRRARWCRFRAVHPKSPDTAVVWWQMKRAFSTENTTNKKQYPGPGSVSIAGCQADDLTFFRASGRYFLDPLVTIPDNKLSLFYLVTKIKIGCADKRWLLSHTSLVRDYVLRALSLLFSFASMTNSCLQSGARRIKPPTSVLESWCRSLVLA